MLRRWPVSLTQVFDRIYFFGIRDSGLGLQVERAKERARERERERERAREREREADLVKKKARRLKPISRLRRGTALASLIVLLSTIVSGFECRVSGVGCRVSSVGCRVSGVGRRASGVGCRVAGCDDLPCVLCRALLRLPLYLSSTVLNLRRKLS